MCSNNTGILYATFYCITALAAIVYYRRRVLSNVKDAITLGLLPVASIVFLGWIAIKSMLNAPAAQNYSLLGFLVDRPRPAADRAVRVALVVLRDPSGELEAG